VIRSFRRVIIQIMKTRLEIDTRTFVRFWLVVIGLGLAIYLLYSAQVALIILGTSLFLALALNTPVSRIARRLPGKSRVGATAIAYVAVVAILGAIVFLVVPPIVQQTAKFVETVPSVVDTATSSWYGLRGFVEEYNLQPQVDSALNSLKENATGWASNVGQSVVSGLGSFFSFLAALFLVLVLTFLMLIEGPMWMKRLWGLYNNKGRMEIHKRIVSRVYGVVTGYITGQLTVSAMGATFAGLVVFVLSLIFPEVPGNLAFTAAAVTFVLSLIPMFGAMIGGVIITAFLAFNNIPAAVIYAIYFVVYQQIENNFVVPRIQAKRNELSALAVLGSVTVGLYMFGLVGGIIAIPIAGTIRVLLDEYLLHAKTQRALNVKT
jgi:predicted PurR-regulated permease PerM